MIDYDEVLDAFIVVARQAVGSQLSQIGPVGNTYPAVIKARQDGPIPSYPYIQIDVLSTALTSGHLLAEWVDEDENTVYETHYKLLLQYTVFGGNANKITHELEAYFRLNSVLNYIENETEGTVEECFSVIPSPQRLSTKWLEVASFNLTFNINDVLLNPNTYLDPEATPEETVFADGVFDTITISGEIPLNPDDDTDKLEFSVTESSNP